MNILFICGSSQDALIYQESNVNCLSKVLLCQSINIYASQFIEYIFFELDEYIFVLCLNVSIYFQSKL